MASQASQPRTTMVLLGASNLTRAMAVVVDTLRLQHGRPLRIVSALGLGRSFGLRSSVLTRSLPSILDCRVWDALQVRCEYAEQPGMALICDIGNDVMYGVPPQQIITWIAQCIDRLASMGFTRINITALPIDSIRCVQRWQYAVVRAALFPSRDISYETALEHAIELQARLERLADRYAPLTHLRMHERHWYGFDPIHLRRRWWPEAWSRFVACDEAAAEARTRLSLPASLRMRTHFPEHFEIAGWAMHCTQPLQIDADTTIEMY